MNMNEERTGSTLRASLGSFAPKFVELTALFAERDSK